MRIDLMRKAKALYRLILFEMHSRQALYKSLNLSVLCIVKTDWTSVIACFNISKPLSDGASDKRRKPIAE